MEPQVGYPLLKYIRAGLDARGITDAQLLRSGEWNTAGPDWAWTVPAEIEASWDHLSIQEKALVAIMAHDLLETSDAE